MDIDLKRLANGNSKGKAIAKSLGYKKTKYWQFLKDHCFSNPTNQDVIVQLNDILYAKELAALLCPQFHKLIFKETKPLQHLTDPEKLSIGYEAIWKALHNYTNPNSSMFHWIMFAIRMYSKKNTREFPQERTIADEMKTYTPDPKQPKPDITHNEETVLNNWIKKANLTQENKIILHFYLTRAAYKGWINDYLKDFKARTGQTRHPKGIVAKMKEIKIKLAKVIRQEGYDLPLAF